ncbi:MAG TPA: ATP synthase F0 subunit B [Candidatus Binataceae bacterium]|nr:ATP synthase F0 subunit B [Candidatus Binataceae bacterium]
MHLPPDWGILGTLVISFLIFWVIFGWLFFGPFLRLLSARERRLNELHAETERLLGEEREVLARREHELSEVRRAALASREQERRAATEQATHLIENARAAARDELEKVRAGIDAEFAAAAQQLEELAGALATELAARVLERPAGNGSQPSLDN